MLTQTQINQMAPAVYSKGYNESKCSSKYKMIPTDALIASMQEAGFHPTQALQAKKNSTSHHIIRFSHESLVSTDEDRPEIVLVNAHDGRSSYRLLSGLFRYICSNGLIVQDDNFGEIRIRHSGDASDLESIIMASLQIANKTKDVMEVTKAMRARILTDKERAQYAHDTAVSRFGSYSEYKKETLDEIYDNASMLLTPRRFEDGGKDLWTTYNVVQENIMKGGLMLNRRTMRPVTNIRRNVILNTDLWNRATQLVNL